MPEFAISSMWHVSCTAYLPSSSKGVGGKENPRIGVTLGIFNMWIQMCCNPCFYNYKAAATKTTVYDEGLLVLLCRD